MKKLLLLLCCLYMGSTSFAQNVSTVLSGVTGPEKVYVDGAGNTYFVTWSTLYKRTPSNVTTSLMTGGAEFSDMAMDGQGNIFLADYQASTIYKITPGGSSSVFSTQVPNPEGITIDRFGNMYASAYLQAQIYKLQQNGTATAYATLASSRALQLSCDTSGNLYCTGGSDGRLYKITSSGNSGAAALLTTISGYAYGCDYAPDGWIYLANYSTGAILRYNPTTNSTQTVAGPVYFNQPTKVFLSRAGDLYVGNRGGNDFKKIGGVYAPPAVIPYAGLDLWLKADADVNTSGGVVTNWKDQSGNGRTAIASGSPLYVTNVINGKPAVRFGGSNAGLTTSSFVTYPNKRGSIFIVSKFSGGSSYGTLVGTYFGSGVAWQFGAYGSSFGYYDGGSYASNVAIGTSSPTQWNIVNLARESDNQQKLYYNGALDGTLTVTNNQAAPNPVKIGWNGLQTNVEVFSGDIAEILVYSYALSQSQRDSVNQYLASKYNITITTTAPAIALNKSSIDFGKLGAGFNLSDSVIISNTGTAPLNISGITSSNPAFALSYAKNTIVPGDTVRLKIRYQPGVVGISTGTVSISHNAGSNSVINLMGEAFASGFTYNIHSLPGFSGNLYGAAWFNGQKGFVCGANGKIYRTLDGGSTWTLVPFGNSSINLRSIRCIGPDLWLFGDNGHICVSHDGGQSFSAFNTNTTESFYDAYFVNPNYGFAVGSNGTICRYNGGWQPYTLSTSANFYGIYCYGTSAWAVGSGGTVCRYNYSTNSWSTINPGPSNNFYGVGFWDNNVGYIVGSGGIICKTTNGGTSWTALNSGVTVDIRGIRCFSANVAWACCADGTILQTTDGGTTWVKLPLGNFNWQRVDFNGCNGIAICHNGAVATFQTTLCSDSYNPYYVRRYLGSPYPMYGACFTSRNNGGICGGYGSVFITNDGGQNWTSSNTNTLSDIRCIRIFGNKAFICGTGGFIAHCNSGGTNWQTFTGLPSGVTFYSMSFYKNGTGWAVGSGGTICYYNGTGWSAYTTNVSVDFRCVYVIGNVAYACGANGTIWKYNGSAWIDVSPGVSNDFYACAFVNPNVGYAVGANGIVCKTTNGGQSWFPLTGPCGCHLYCVKVGCINEVMVAGVGGNAYQSTDGGANWTSRNLGQSTDIHDVHLAGDAGYIAGADGGAYAFDFGSDTLTTAITAAGPTTFCAGGSVTLTARGGSNYSYAWSDNTTNASANAQSGGVYSVTVTDPLGCVATASETITVNPNPVVAISASGSTSFCQGGSVTLTASGADSYVWSDNATTNSITVDASGTYSVTGTNAYGCTASASTAVTVHPLPTLSASISSTPGADNCGSNTIYIGYGPQSLNLSISGATGGTPTYSYSWTPAASVSNSSVTSGTASATVSPTATTTYTVTVTDANGCTDTKSTTVRVRDVRCGSNNDKVQVCHNTGSATNATNAICISPNAVPAHLANHNDCLGDCSNPFAKASASATGRMNLEEGSIVVFPNPAHSKINVELKETGSAYKACQIIDITGRVVLSSPINGDIHSDLISIDITSLSPGMYMLKGVTETGANLAKFVVE